MATKASPRSNSSSASSSSSRRNYNNAHFIREQDGITSDRWERAQPNFTKLSSGFTSKASFDSTHQNMAQWGGNTSETGRGLTIQGSHGGRWAETEGPYSSFSITDRKDERTTSWRSNKQGVQDQFAGGRSKGIQPSNKVYQNSREYQNMSRVQPPASPGETWKQHGSIRGAWNQAARPQGVGVEQVQVSRSQYTNIPEPRRWENHRPNFSGNDAYASSDVISTNYVRKLPSFKSTTGIASEARIEHSDINSIAYSHEKSHKLNNRGWESPGSMGGSTNRRFDGYGSAVPQLATRGDWRQNTKKELDVRKGGAHGSMSHVGHSLNSPSASGWSGGSKKEGAAGQPSVGSGRSERFASVEEESVVAPKDYKGSLAPHADSEGLDDAMLPFVVGSCEDMCPVKEREQRERLRDLAVFERLNGNPRKTSRELAVKKFCRTVSGVNLQPADVRPLPILWNTLQYILNLLDDHEYSFDVVHNFLFDRTRAIRQELGMQRIANSQAITMYEEIVRFHILSEHELNQRGSGRYTSDSHLNLQQLSKSLTSLFDLYHLKSGGISKSEGEFRAYYVLLNLGGLSRYQAESLSIWFRQFPSTFLNVPEMKFTRKMLRCYRLGNFKAFFQLVLGATFLQGCLLELHFNEVRLKALEAINQGGYKLHPIPLADISKILLMKEGDLEELCNLCGLSTGMDSCRVRCLLAKQSQFSLPKEIPCYRCPFLVNKRALSYYEEVVGANRKS